jgi:hypothetical protein
MFHVEHSYGSTPCVFVRNMDYAPAGRTGAAGRGRSPTGKGSRAGMTRSGLGPTGPCPCLAGSDTGRGPRCCANVGDQDTAGNDRARGPRITGHAAGAALQGERITTGGHDAGATDHDRRGTLHAAANTDHRPPATMHGTRATIRLAGNTGRGARLYCYGHKKARAGRAR